MSAQDKRPSLLWSCGSCGHAYDRHDPDCSHGRGISRQGCSCPEFRRDLRSLREAWVVAKVKARQAIQAEENARLAYHEAQREIAEKGS